MSNDQLDDLKQFISASISQSEERLRSEMNQGFQSVRQEMADGLQEVRQEVSDGFLAVGEAIEEIHQQFNEHHSTTDARLTKLEHQVA